MIEAAAARDYGWRVVGGSTASALWPLTGRDIELENIATARGDTRCRGVVLSAAAGVGKSRLAREAHSAAERDGALVGWVQATSSAASVPLGAFASLIPDDARTDDTLRLMRHSADVLVERASGRRIVVSVDDAQLLDPVSAALVLHLTNTDTAFVIATVRSGEPCPDAIVSLWKDAGARRMELQRLSDEAVGMLVEAALDGPVEQSALRWVVETSQGNALYVRELVSAAVDGGTLTCTRGLWRLSGPPAISPSLAELVSRRMAGLGNGERGALELLAVGEPLTLDEVAGLADYSALVELESRGLVAVEGEQVRLAHPLHGEVLRQELPVLRARHHRLRVADTIRERDRLAPSDALRVARLLLDAGAEIPADLLVDAARAANVAGDPELGAELAERARAHGAGVPAALVLARAHSLRKRYEEAESVLASVADDVGPDRLGLEYLAECVEVLFWGLYKEADTRALLGYARGWSTDPDWQRQLLPLRLIYAAAEDDHEAAVAALRGLRDDPATDAATRAMAERRLAVWLFFMGQAREADELARRQRPRVPLRDHGDALALGIGRLIAFESGENLPGLDVLMGKTLQEAVRFNDHEAAGHAAFSLGYTNHLAGRYRDAARWYEEAELHFELQDTFGTLIHVRAMRVGADYFAGEIEAALASLERMHAALGGRTPLSTQAAYVARAEGWAARIDGTAAASRWFLDAADALSHMPGFAAQLVYEALRAGGPAGAVADQLTPLAARCDARLVEAYAAHATALAARDGEALLAVADEMASIGALAYGVEASVNAGDTFVAAGREDSARRAAARARELHVAGQGTEPPVIDGLDGPATMLTSREAQLVELARRDLSNAEIADQLVLSVRTVETHLYRAMRKLGVSDRREL
jgi:DNA-binding CsgD family transcriptional regulator